MVGITGIPGFVRVMPVFDRLFLIVENPVENHLVLPSINRFAMVIFGDNKNLTCGQNKFCFGLSPCSGAVLKSIQRRVTILVE